MRYSLAKLALFVLVFFFTTEKSAAEPLRDAVIAALQYHPSVEAALADLDSSKAQRREFSSGYFPELAVSGTGGRVFQDNSTSRGLSVTRGDAYSYFGEGSVTFKQMLFDGLETPSRVASAREKRNAAISTVADLRETLALRTVQAYTDVLRTRLALVMLDQHTNKVSGYMKRIEASVNEGGSDEAELQQAKDVEAILSSIRSDYEAQARAADTNYQELTGNMPGPNLVKPPMINHDADKDISEIIAVALEAHPSITAAMHQSTASRYDISAEKAQLFPSFDGELSYMESDKKDVIGGEIKDARAVVKMNWSFSTGGAQMARIKQKKLEHKKSKSRLAELKRQIERDMRLAHSEYVTAREQLDILYKRSLLNEKLFNTYAVQFDGGKISLLQLMQSENQLFNTKLEQMNTEHRLLGASYGVLASVGSLQKSLKLDALDLAHEDHGSE